MAEDFLNRLAKTSKEQLGKQVSPYKVGTEKTRPVQVRISTYKDIKKLAFESDRKIVDVVDDLLRYGLEHKNNK